MQRERLCSKYIRIDIDIDIDAPPHDIELHRRLTRGGAVVQWRCVLWCICCCICIIMLLCLTVVAASLHSASFRSNPDLIYLNSIRFEHITSSASARRFDLFAWLGTQTAVIS